MRIAQTKQAGGKKEQKMSDRTLLRKTRFLTPCNKDSLPKPRKLDSPLRLLEEFPGL